MNVTLYAINASCIRSGKSDMLLLGKLSFPIREGARVAGGKGLEEVVAAQTAISDIDGKLGKLWYAGYSIDDLARNSTFEEVTFLLHHGRLPNRDELDELTEQMVNDRQAAAFLSHIMPTLAEQ